MFTYCFTILFTYGILVVKGFVYMDKEWLKYWQKVEDLELGENDEAELGNKPKEKPKEEELKEAQDLYKTVLSDKK